MELCEINSELRDLVEQAAPQSAHAAAALQERLPHRCIRRGSSQVIAGNTTMEEIRCLSLHRNLTSPHPESTHIMRTWNNPAPASFDQSQLRHHGTILVVDDDRSFAP